MNSEPLARINWPPTERVGSILGRPLIIEIIIGEAISFGLMSAAVLDSKSLEDLPLSLSSSGVTADSTMSS